MRALASIGQMETVGQKFSVQIVNEWQVEYRIPLLIDQKHFWLALQRKLTGLGDLFEVEVELHF